jgi:hypothetical protein
VADTYKYIMILSQLCGKNIASYSKYTIILTLGVDGVLSDVGNGPTSVVIGARATTG